MESNDSVSPFNISYVIVTGIIYIIVAKGFGSGVEFVKTFVVSLLDFIGGFAGLGDTLYSQSQNNLLTADPYFWFLFFMIGSIFSVGISYYLSNEGIANKIYSAIGTSFSQLIIGRVVTVQRVTLPVQAVLLIVAFGIYILHCEKLHKSVILIIMAPLLLPALELLIILPFVLVASKLPDFFAIVVTIVGFIIAVFICYPLLSSFYYRNIICVDANICSFNIIWVIGVLVFCILFGNQPQENVTNTNITTTDETEYHNNLVERLHDMLLDGLEQSANWLSEGEYERIKNGENVDSVKESVESK